MITAADALAQTLELKGKLNEIMAPIEAKIVEAINNGDYSTVVNLETPYGGVIKAVLKQNGYKIAEKSLPATKLNRHPDGMVSHWHTLEFWLTIKWGEDQKDTDQPVNP